MRILVTGGAGYIGSQMVRQLKEANHEVIVLDSLENGHKENLDSSIPFYQGSTDDKEVLTKVFSENQIDAVFHFAAYLMVSESVTNPGKYFSNNVCGTLNLLDSMMEHTIKKIIFSSTAAVYGNQANVPIKEDEEKHPESPYGETKLMVETVLKDYDKAYGLKSVSLRYFNAAGAALDGSSGEAHKTETHIIPLAIKAALNNTSFTLNGTDYPTEDGTCIRDYVHIIDLCQAHLLALDYLEKGGETTQFNVSPGVGLSNLQVVEAIKKISGKDFPITKANRRPGDPAVLVADSSKIKQLLHWEPKYSDLHTIIETAWKWHSTHPDGYK